jgi:LAO/AO transport system kinase
MSSELAKRILKGDIRAVASVMTLIEDGDRRAKPVLKAIYPRTGNAHVVGVTGAAGTGKSSLIDRLTAAYRKRNRSVGILAVDPSSVFSTGAVLGDRVRLREHFLDDAVFIRSFASRGHTGGLAAAVRDAIHVLDAMGKEVIFVETIGVGQDELEIAKLADTVVVVLMPYAGDEVQAMKAGCAEIADILVVSKADLAGADKTLRDVKATFGDSYPLVMATSALKTEGIDLLADSIEQRRAQSLRNGSYQRKRRDLCRQELLSLLQARIFAELSEKIGADFLDQTARLLAERRLDPYSAMEQIAKKAGL